MLVLVLVAFLFFLLFRLFDTEIPLLIWQSSVLRVGRKDKGRLGPYLEQI
jgi:hypothetical protein